MSKKMWVYYQPNQLDLKDNYGDCTIRALSKVFGLSWIDTFKMCEPVIEKYQLLPNYFFFAGQEDYIVEMLKLKRYKISNKKGSKRPTVKSFCSTHPQGVYLLKVAHHVVAVVDGKYYDTWDCGEKSLYGYYERVV